MVEWFSGSVVGWCRDGDLAGDHLTSRFKRDFLLTTNELMFLFNL